MPQDPIYIWPVASAVSLLVAYGLVHLRRLEPVQRRMGLLFLTGAAYLVSSGAHSWTPAVAAALAALAAPGPLVFAMTARASFDDRPLRPGLVGTLLPLLVVLAAGPALLDRGHPLKGPLSLAFAALALALFGATLAVTVRGLADDLVDERRRSRAWFVALGSIIGVAASSAALLALAHTDLVRPMTAAATVLTLLGYGWRHLGVELPAVGRTAAPARPAPPPSMAADLLERRIRHAFEVERFHRHEDLTLSKLAARLDAPEHHVRAVINRAIGFRNFSAFLNSWRLGEVRAALEDPSQAQTPITTIALDAGYQSIATFNRAFRETFGVTPSAYRSRAAERCAQAAPTIQPTTKSVAANDGSN